MGINWKNKKVAILGIGMEGIATARYLKKQGALIRLLDKNDEAKLDHEQIVQAKKIADTLIFGEKYLDELSAFNIIIRSPGVRRLIPQLTEAAKKGILITSHTQIFLDVCPCPVIGVTGTKGKGTTASLIHSMLLAEGKDAHIGGNIGIPPLDFLEKLTAKSWVVLEFSSFQLQDLHVSPHIAVMLMVTSEHLDYHNDVEEYIDAKRNLVRFQTRSDFAIVNRDYPASNESDIHTEGSVYYITRERESVEQGCFVRDHVVWIRNEGNEKKVIDVRDILLPGKHNLENICAAVMAATLAGVSLEAIKTVLSAFKGLEHRLELVGEVNGVRYYDDSFSTTPETAIAAIHAFTQPEVLILGGASKNSDFSELGKIIGLSKNIRGIVGIGLEWPRIKEEIVKHTDKIFMVEGAMDMQTIVKAASTMAESGDVVLLTPACKSFDMFKNYKERGQLFKEEVMSLL